MREWWIVFPYNAIHNGSLSVVRRITPIRLEKHAMGVKCIWLGQRDNEKHRTSTCQSESGYSLASPQHDRSQQGQTFNASVPDQKIKYIYSHPYPIGTFAQRA